MTESSVFQFLKFQKFYLSPSFLCIFLEIRGKHNTHQVKGSKSLWKQKRNEEKEVTLVWETYKSKRTSPHTFLGFFFESFSASGAFFLSFLSLFLRAVMWALRMVE